MKNCVEGLIVNSSSIVKFWQAKVDKLLLQFKISILDIKGNRSENTTFYAHGWIEGGGVFWTIKKPISGVTRNNFPRKLKHNHVSQNKLG